MKTDAAPKDGAVERLPYESHDLEDVAQLLAGSSRLWPSVEVASPSAQQWLREWATDVLSRSTFGTQSYACLEGNWPRGVEFEVLDLLLHKLKDL